MVIGAPPAENITKVNIEPIHLFQQENLANKRPADVCATFKKPLDTPGGPMTSHLAFDISIVGDPLTCATTIMGSNNKMEGFGYPPCVTTGELRKANETYNKLSSTGVAEKLHAQNVSFCPVIVSSMGAMGSYLNHLLEGTTKNSKSALQSSHPSLWCSNKGVTEPIHFPLGFGGQLPAASQHQRKGDDSDLPRQWWAIGAAKQLAIKLSNTVISAFYNYHILMTLPVSGRIPSEKDAAIYHLQRGDFPSITNPPTSSFTPEGNAGNSNDDMRSVAPTATTLTTSTGRANLDQPNFSSPMTDSHDDSSGSYDLLPYDDENHYLPPATATSACTCTELRRQFVLNQNQLRFNVLDSPLNPPSILSLTSDINEYGIKLCNNVTRETYSEDSYREAFLIQYQTKYILCKHCLSNPRVFWKWDG
jgi:hypothetical protein